MKRFPYFCSLFLLCCFAASPACAAQDEPPQSWRLLADKTVASHDSKYLEAFGDVVLDRGADYIRAEYARYYHNTRWVYLKGQIEARFQGDFLKADEAEFDLNTNIGWLKNGQVFMADPHMYFSGKLLKRTGKQTYQFREATVTACDGKKPIWSIKATRGDITIDGYANLWGPRFQILDQPVLFSPYAVIPVKTKRQSGFLLPEIASSDKQGFIYNQPYYQVLDEEQDLTIFSNAMSTKGLMLGLEYRLTPNIHSKGLWRIDYLYNDQKEATTLYADNGNMERANHSRWWLRGKYDGFLIIPDWDLKLDVDLVSDQDYLREFSKGYSGFEKSRKHFLHRFGRDIADKDDNLRVNRLLLSRNWAHAGVQGLLEYTQNLTYGANNRNKNHDSSHDPTIQRLPEINAYLYQIGIPYTPFELEASGQFVSFWREYGTKGTRFDVHPRLSLPFHSAYGSLIPKIGWRGTAYFIEKYDQEVPGIKTQNSVQTRSIPDFSATAYTEFSRIFGLKASDSLPKDGSLHWVKLRHDLQPRLEYTYIPHVDQDRYPEFDEVDRIQAQNNLTYSLTNILTSKKGSLSPDPTQQGTLTPQFQFIEQARIRLEQSYNFHEATRKEALKRYERRPFSDILLDITAPLSPWASLTSKTWYSPYLAAVTEHEHSLALEWPDKGGVSFGLDFLRDLDEYTRQNQEKQRIAALGGHVSFLQPWRFSVLYRRDFEADIDLEKTLTLSYTHQCFSTEAFWSKTDTDTRIGIMINLLQLGSIGKETSKSHED